MKFLRQFAPYIVAASLFAAPTLACMAPAAQLTAEEKSCCEAMHGKCDEMEMPQSSHSCCQPKPTTGIRSYLVQVKTWPSNFAPAVAAAVFAPSKLLLRPSFEFARRNNVDPSPPNAATLYILRI